MNIFFETILTYVGKRLTEPSTWRGIVLFVAGSWGEQHPETTDNIINYTFIVVGLIGALLPDSVIKRENKENLKKTIETGLDNLFSKSNEEVSPIDESMETTTPAGFNDQSPLPSSPLENNDTSVRPSCPRVSNSSSVQNNNSKPSISSTTTTSRKNIERVPNKSTSSQDENFSSGFNDK